MQTTQQAQREFASRVFGVNAKAVLIRVAHGGAVPECSDDEVSKLLQGLAREARLLRWLACSCLPDVHSHLIGDKTHDWPENSCFHYLWSTVENWILMSWQAWAMTKPVKHISLHFDGIMLDEQRVSMEDDFA